jgi:hypothetical protein
MFVVTRNISSGGVLFTSDTEPDAGVSIEYLIAIPGTLEPSVTLHCAGRVLRSHKVSDVEQPAYAWAASMERHKFVRPEAAAPPEASRELAGTM